MVVMTAENGTRSVIKLNSSDWIQDTETTMAFTPGDNAISGKTRMLPGLQRWSRPSTAQLRKWADELLQGTGMVRDGAIEFRNDGPVTSWFFTYHLRPENRHPRKEHRGIGGLGYCSECGQKPTSTRFVHGRCRGSWDS